MRLADWCRSCVWRRGRAGAAVALLVSSAACISNPAPRSWLPRAEPATRDVYGAWIVVTTSQTATTAPSIFAGEFLAVGRDTVFVLTLGGAVKPIPTGDVQRARVAFYDAEWGGLGAWTALGTLSTISNGFYLVLTAPAWLLGGSGVTASQSKAPIRDVTEVGDWSKVSMYARFPGGWPDKLPRELPRKDVRD